MKNRFATFCDRGGRVRPARGVGRCAGRRGFRVGWLAGAWALGIVCAAGPAGAVDTVEVWWTGAVNGVVSNPANWAGDSLGVGTVASLGVNSILHCSADTILYGPSSLGSHLGVNSLIYTTGTSVQTTGSGVFTLALGGGGIALSSSAADVSIGNASGANRIQLLLLESQVWSNYSALNTLTAINGVDNGGNVLTVGGVGRVTLAGVLSGSGGLAKTDSGTLRLLSSNTFTGGLTLNGGEVMLGSGALNATAGSENRVVFGSGSTGMLSLSGASTVVASLDSNAGALGSPKVANFGDPATLTVGNALNLSSAFGGVIQNGIGSAPLGLSKEGTGRLTLSGANTYTGVTAVEAGVLELADGGSILASGRVSISGGTLLIQPASSGDAIANPLPIRMESTSVGEVSTLKLGGAVLETMGALTLSGTVGKRVIDFGAASGILRLASLSGAEANTTLEVWNWTGSIYASGGVDQLIVDGGFGANMDLSQITFFSDAGQTALGPTAWATYYLGSTTGELVPIPEAGTMAGLLALLAPLAWKERKHWMRCRLAG